MCYNRKQVTTTPKVWYYGSEAFHGFHFPLPEKKHPIPLEKARQTLRSWAIIKEKHGWLHDLAMFMIYYGGTNNTFLCDLIRHIAYNNRLSEAQIVRGIQVASRYIPTTPGPDGKLPTPTTSAPKKEESKRYFGNEENAFNLKYHARPEKKAKLYMGRMPDGSGSYMNRKDYIANHYKVTLEKHGWLYYLAAIIVQYEPMDRSWYESVIKGIARGEGVSETNIIQVLLACFGRRPC